jgi:hypothetical protein
MKTILCAGLILTAFAAMPAMAGEGNGEPFPAYNGGLTTIVTSQRADVGSAAYPDIRGRPGTFIELSAGAIVPETGSEQPIQTANSLPPGFTAGLPVYAQLPSVQPARTAQVAQHSIYLPRY